MEAAVIIDGVRTPVGKRNGALSNWHPTDLLALTLRTLVDRTEIEPACLDDVIGGCARQVGEQSGNLTRFASLGAGLLESLPATTVDRQCGSGQQAVHFAAQGIRSGEYDFAIAAGVESMSRVDLGPLFDPDAAQAPFYGHAASAHYNGNLCAQGPSAEMIVGKWGSPAKNSMNTAWRAIAGRTRQRKPASSLTISFRFRGSIGTKGSGGSRIRRKWRH